MTWNLTDTRNTRMTTRRRHRQMAVLADYALSAVMVTAFVAFATVMVWAVA
jgi:hypothetical protein